MKLFLPLFILLIIGMFFLGIIAPRRSRNAQRKIDHKSKEAEERLRDKDNKMADWTATSMEAGRKATDKSAAAGRTVRDKMSGDKTKND